MTEAIAVASLRLGKLIKHWGRRRGQVKLARHSVDCDSDADERHRCFWASSVGPSKVMRAGDVCTTHPVPTRARLAVIQGRDYPDLLFRWFVGLGIKEPEPTDRNRLSVTLYWLTLTLTASGPLKSRRREYAPSYARQ